MSLEFVQGCHPGRRGAIGVDAETSHPPPGGARAGPTEARRGHDGAGRRVRERRRRRAAPCPAEETSYGPQTSCRLWRSQFLGSSGTGPTEPRDAFFPEAFSALSLRFSR
ncbi:hypothetical protein B005_4582 [Nocardiopsis alba ATCC BAA-2165]|uniref:Uncharacterized protein n=1 Tax=Nocardiopsis alba (strain ATCC BAA-2165 / BE74) TaxID=1205910 RepID=J7LB57_NOCAA|nr:hypothetical protein B005_4582 [Nocardiopsis alba ATCC BAA-2165]